jgi:hypothetical protein
VVQLHDPPADVRLERRVVVGQLRQGVDRHFLVLSSQDVDTTDARTSTPVEVNDTGAGGTVIVDTPAVDTVTRVTAPGR